MVWMGSFGRENIKNENRREIFVLCMVNNLTIGNIFYKHKKYDESL